VRKGNEDRITRYPIMDKIENSNNDSSSYCGELELTLILVRVKSKWSGDRDLSCGNQVGIKIVI
jgi:hypothetical protein